MLLGARYCNPSVGRFATLDPIKDGENWYVYVENQPLGSVDPDGMEKWTCKNTKPPSTKDPIKRAIYRFYWCKGCLESCEEWCLEEANKHCWNDRKYDKCVEACSKGYRKCLANKKQYKFEISF